MTAITSTKRIPEVGDIVVATWGYEARIPDFYKVTKILNGFATLQELEGVYVGHGKAYDSSLLMPGKPTEEKPFRRKIQGDFTNGYYIKINSYKYAHAWDGEPEERYNHH